MRLWPESPPPGPFRPAFWRSPLRGPWLTSMLGAALLVLLPLVALTGLLSNAAYDPRLGANAVGRPLGPLDFYLFSWPTHPAWLYAANQGLHVTLGLASIPVLLAKLWSVIPRLFEWPPLRSPAHALERASLALLVSGAVFEFVTGVMNIQNDYAFSFFFTDAHYYGAWLFIAALAFHVAIKLPTLRRTLGARRALAPLRDGLADTRPEQRSGNAAGSDLIPVSPAAATMSRRTLLGTVAAGSALLFVQGAGQSLGGPLRRLAFLAPRGRNPGRGPNGFQINRTFDATGIDPADLGSRWRLRLSGGPRAVELTLAELAAMPQHTYVLPIGCVEGWSTTQRWTGVRLRDLARAAGVELVDSMTARSLEQYSNYNEATLSGSQIADARSLLALRVNGATLSRDHGLPARVIAPGLPGVHCTKWVRELSFRRA
jgi:DMSO/TMAO reductase YedYZ molybdopterin-dependent catalytic subunit